MTLEVDEGTLHKLMRDMFIMWCEQEGKNEIQSATGSKQLIALAQIRRFHEWLKKSDWWAEDANPEARDELFDDLLYSNYDLYDEAWIFVKDNLKYLTDGHETAHIVLYNGDVLTYKWEDEGQFVDWEVC